jgi:hypothetical protein
MKDATLRYATSRSTLYLLLKKGSIRGVKRGGRTLVDVESAGKYFGQLPEIKFNKQ